MFTQGTWYYMSSALLYHLGKEHSVHDDLQSVFWVFSHMSYDYLPHDLPVQQLALSFVEYDEDPTTREESGGARKLAYLIRGDRFSFIGNSALSRLYEQFREGIRALEDWYESLKSGRTEQELAVAVHNPPDNVPDHNYFLHLFTEALNAPDQEWSSERSDKRPLQMALKALQERSQAKCRAATSATSHKHLKRPRPLTPASTTTAKKARIQSGSNSKA